MGEYRFFDHGGTRIGAVMSGMRMPATSRAGAITSASPSIPKAAEAVKAGGGTIAMGPMEGPGRRPHHHRT